MKNLKFTFWLIGFGCGMVVSGIIGALFTINLEAHETGRESIRLEANQLSECEQEEVEEKTKAEQKQVVQEKKEVPNVSEQIAQKPHDEVSTTSILKVVEKKYCEIEIPKNVSAMEICDLLEEKDIIDSSEAFLEYVKSRNMQSRLRAGKVKLPVSGSQEEVLNLLIYS